MMDSLVSVLAVSLLFVALGLVSRGGTRTSRCGPCPGKCASDSEEKVRRLNNEP